MTLLRFILLFVRIENLHVKICFEKVKNLAFNILLEKPFINWHICQTFPGERKVVPWHSSVVLIFTKSLKIERRPLSSVEPSRRRFLHDDATVRATKKVDLKPVTQTGVILSLALTELLYMESVHLGDEYRHLHLAPEIVESTRSEAVHIFIGSLHTKRVPLRKDMVVAHRTEPPLLIIDIPHPAQGWEAATERSVSLDESLLTSVRYKLAEDQELQIN